jgi:hypothetical protein
MSCRPMLHRKTAGLLARLLYPSGGVAEWLKATDFKSVEGLPFPRGFESCPLRTGSRASRTHGVILPRRRVHVKM